MIRSSVHCQFVCLLATCVTVGCEGAADEPPVAGPTSKPAVASRAAPSTNRVELDGAALARLGAIETEMRRSPAGRCGPDSLRVLREMRERYPDAAEVRDAYGRALRAMEDWGALIELYAPRAAQLSHQERVTLATVYYKAGRFREAAELFQQLADQHPDDFSLARGSAHALYFAGEHARAAAIMDRVWEELVASRRTDTMVMRALIHFDAGDADRAIEVLEQAEAIAPESVPIHNALARVLAAAGREEQADAHARRAAEIHARNTAEEHRQLRLSAQARALNEAFAAGRYGECEKLLDQMIPVAQGRTQAGLYRYRAAVYEALEQPGKADAARERAEAIERDIR